MMARACPASQTARLYQIAALDGIARAEGGRVSYVKPHGALYNTAAVDVYQASAVVAAIVDYDRALPVLCLPGSTLAAVATGAGLRVVPEGYADRAYQPDGTLVPRRKPGAVISTVDSVAERAVRMAVAGEVVAIDDTLVATPAESICVHGDTAGAVELARRVREALDASGVSLKPFATLL